jgi:hypothetical protein
LWRSYKHIPTLFFKFLWDATVPGNKKVRFLKIFAEARLAIHRGDAEHANESISLSLKFYDSRDPFSVVTKREEPRSEMRIAMPTFGLFDDLPCTHASMNKPQEKCRFWEPEIDSGKKKRRCESHLRTCPPCLSRRSAVRRPMLLLNQRQKILSRIIFQSY